MPPEEPKTLNLLGYSGRVIKDPKITLNLTDTPSQPFGAFGDEGIDSAIEWLIMTVKNIPYGDVQKYCEEHKPTITVYRAPRITGLLGSEETFTYGDGKK